MDLSNDGTDEEISKKVQSGDIESFGILVKRYEEKLMRYARKFLSDKRDIEEIVQEVFIKSYINIKGFDSSRKFSSWIYRIAHNELVNCIKKKRRNPLFYFDLDVLFPHFISKESIEEEINKKEVKEIINKCLDKISIKYKEPLFLYYFEELSYKEISDVLRIPISTVGVRIKRGKKIIKSIYKKTKK